MQSRKHSQDTLDLRGMSCPMNFVYIKTALERPAPGTVLAVRLDGQPVARDVAVSLEAQGYQVLSLEEKPGETLLRVRKKS